MLISYCSQVHHGTFYTKTEQIIILAGHSILPLTYNSPTYLPILPLDYNSLTCPRCVVPRDERGEHKDYPLRDQAATMITLTRHGRGEDPYLFDDEGLRAIHHPFWADFPHTDIFACITPDILHQLHKGVFKDHLMKWCTSIASEDEVNARFKAMTDYHGLRHFKTSGKVQFT
jgi:hypothetical protein